MPIELSTQLIHASIADVLAQIDPNAEIFDNPSQQGTPYPAWYIVHRSPVERQRECGNRYILVYQIDIWYMLKQNITRLYDQYTSVAERLQENIEYLPIYGHKGVLVHTYDNSWGLELNAMKYSITLRLRCSRSTVPGPKMAVIEDLQVFLKGLGKFKRIHYECPQFPEFDLGIESMQYCIEGDSVVLPFVSGLYRDTDGNRWEPLSWNVGPFGSQYGPITDDMTINLVMGIVVGFDVVIGGTVGIGQNLGEDIVWRISGMTRDMGRSVGPMKNLGEAPMMAGADLSRDTYEPIGPQKNLGPSPIMGCTVTPYVREKKMYLYPSKENTDVTIATQYITLVYDEQSNAIPYDSAKNYILVGVYEQDGTETKAYEEAWGQLYELNLSTDDVFMFVEYPTSPKGRLGMRRNMPVYDSSGSYLQAAYFTYITTDK